MTEEGTSKTLEDPSVWEDSVSTIYLKINFIVGIYSYTSTLHYILNS